MNGRDSKHSIANTIMVTPRVGRAAWSPGELTVGELALLRGPELDSALQSGRCTQGVNRSSDTTWTWINAL